jgi:hypothetical protein
MATYTWVGSSGASWSDPNNWVDADNGTRPPARGGPPLQARSVVSNETDTIR